MQSRKPRAEIDPTPPRIPCRQRPKPLNRHFREFLALVLSRFDSLATDLGADVKKGTSSDTTHLSLGPSPNAELQREAFLFRKALRDAFYLASDKGEISRQRNPLFFNLRNAFVKQEMRGLVNEIKYSFQSFILRNRLPSAITERHMDLADIRYPYEWFPATRMLQRTIHLHVGPTNSGKTYNALKALEVAKSGIYAGPLRLLAHEIYTRFQAKGIPCSLITGEEQRPATQDDGRFFSSCTVEMTPLNRRVDVAVIDEIQMIADDQRGWAWTNAFLGVQAKEVHLCGEERAVELIQDFCARIGDKCVVHRYERLNELRAMDESLRGDLTELQKGDCVVSFSKFSLHKLKIGVERATGRRCAIVYGSLPPETRAQQATLFNNPDNDYDFLVASDAIGMGLNLEIRRVIFETTSKYDGMAWRILHVPEIKQIAGRAGRYKTASKANQEALAEQEAQVHQADTLFTSDPALDQHTEQQTPSTGSVAPGYVTTLDQEDLPLIQKSLDATAKPIKTAGLKPPAFILEQVAGYFPPRTPYAFIMARLRELCRLSEKFHLCDFTDDIDISEHIHEYNLSIQDRMTFVACPISLNNISAVEALKEMANCVAENKSGHLLELQSLDLEILDVSPRTHDIGEPIYLGRLESLHKMLTMYLWLSYRFEGVFQSQQLAFHVKSLVEEKIAAHLEQLNFAPEKDAKIREKRRRLAIQHEKTVADVFLEHDSDGEEGEEVHLDDSESAPPEDGEGPPIGDVYMDEDESGLRKGGEGAFADGGDAVNDDNRMSASATR